MQLLCAVRVSGGFDVFTCISIYNYCATHVFSRTTKGNKKRSCYTTTERLENNFELDEIKYMYMMNDPKPDVG
jgi:hypothetical protein